MFSGSSKRRVAERPGVDETATYIGMDVQLEGLIRGKGVLRIEGQLAGQVEHEGTVVVGSKAEVRAKLRVRELIIEGYVEGTIEAERCEIAGTASVMADIRAQKLSMAEGASISGGIFTNQLQEADVRVQMQPALDS